MSTPTLMGIFAGLYVAVYSNAVRKLPIMRNPWEHFLYAGVGAYAMNTLVAYEAKVEEDVRVLLEKREKSTRTFRELQQS